MLKSRFAIAMTIAFLGTLLVGGQSPASADPVTVSPRNQTISTNDFNTCIISAASRLQCWGDQYSGVMTPIVIPTSVADLAVKSVSTNEYNTCVLATTDTLYCWGYLTDNAGTHLPVSSSLAVTDVFTWEDVKAYSASGSNICVIPASASAYCWGFRYTPTGYGVEQNIVPDGLGAAKSVSTNFYNTCVTLVAGGVTCWGYQLYGYGFSPISAPTDLGNVVSLSTSASNACAVQSTGVVRCWGRQYASDNWDSQHFLIDIAVPSDLAAAVSVSTNDTNTCVTLVSGPLQCWGRTESEFPNTSLVVPAGLSRVAGVSTGSYNTCAVKATGTVQCWGKQMISDAWSTISVPSGMATANIGTTQSPGSVGVEIGQGSLTVSWNTVQPMVRGNTVTYTAYAGSAAHSCTTTTTSCEITGLTNGQSYAVTVVASDGDYASVPSDVVDGLPIGPASAPTITSAITGSGKVTLTIGAPAELGDVALTGYEYSTNHGSTWAAFGSLTGPFVITGLTNGTTYLLKVRAVNSWGVGTASGTTTATPTNLTPAVVAIASTTVGDKSVTLGITAPEGVTAASVSGYKYSVNNGVSWLTGSVTDGVMTITGLHNGVTYSIKVRAVNSNGSGVASTRVTARPCAPATAPTITSVTGGNAKATVVFEEPDDNGGTVVTNYEYSLNGGSTWVTPTRRVTRSPLIITGLTNGTTYSVALRAVTAAGSGAASDSSDVTPATVPGAPSVAVSAVASTSVNITLTAPASNGGSEILSYYYTLDSGKTWVPVAVSAIGSSVAVTGLSTYKSYSVRVKATNTAGSSLSSAAKSFKTLH